MSGLLWLVPGWLALWPVAQWLWERFHDGSQGSLEGLVGLGLVALVTGKRQEPAPHSWLPLALALGLYAAAFPWSPDLLRGILGALVVATGLSLWRYGSAFHGGIWGLSVLALPGLATLQFYFGYPLRLIGTRGGCALLGLSGYRVHPEGLALRWGEHLISVDAPCSGVQTLWASLALLLLAASLLGLGSRKTAAALALGALGATLANIFRVAGLFFVEGGFLPQAPSWVHEACGLVCFLLFLVPLLAWMARWEGVPPTIGSSPEGYRRLYLLACCVAAVVPLCTAPSATTPESIPFAGWPGQFEGRPLRALDTSESAGARAFYRIFPGRIGRFSDGEREIVLRWVTRPTRQLHPAADCFRGQGYRIQPGPLERDPQGQLWGSFRATRGDRSYVVRERIFGAGSEEGWTDVSAWFWQTTLARSPGPWWAVTVVSLL